MYTSETVGTPVKLHTSKVNWGVFVDSRFFPYPDAMLQEHVRVELTGDSAETFRRYDIHCAYLPAQSLVGNGLLKSGWKDLYRDDQWAVLSAP